eukprot:1430855-Rhodomonas_salina.1
MNLANLPGSSKRSNKSNATGTWIGSKRTLGGTSARRLSSEGVSNQGSQHGSPGPPGSVHGSYKSGPGSIHGSYMSRDRRLSTTSSMDLHSDHDKSRHSDLVVPTQGALSTMFLQAFSALLLLGFVALGGWLSSVLLYHAYRRSGFSELALFVPVAICVFKGSLMVMAFFCKWVLLGRQQPCTYIYWSLPYLKWWLIHNMFDILDLLVLGPLKGTFLLNWWFAALGVRVGQNVTILTTKLYDFDLIELDDNVWVEDGAVLQPHSFTRDGLSVRPVDVGSGSWLGPTAHLNPSPNSACKLAHNTRMPRVHGAHASSRTTSSGAQVHSHDSKSAPSVWWHIAGVITQLALEWSSLTLALFTFTRLGVESETVSVYVQVRFACVSFTLVILLSHLIGYALICRVCQPLMHQFPGLSCV